MLLVASGCSTGVQLGPQANKKTCLSGSVGWNHVSATLPLISVDARVVKSESKE
jgi:hypothetical protein